jgi:hypothetical protein
MTKKKRFMLIQLGPYRNCLLFIKKRKKCFSIVLNIFFVFLCIFYGICNKFLKFLKDLANISIILSFFFFFLSLKINGQHLGINVGPTCKLIFKYQEFTRKFLEFI